MKRAMPGSAYAQTVAPLPFAMGTQGYPFGYPGVPVVSTDTPPWSDGQHRAGRSEGEHRSDASGTEYGEGRCPPNLQSKNFWERYGFVSHRAWIEYLPPQPSRDRRSASKSASSV
jgi:hypothetical protein